MRGLLQTEPQNNQAKELERLIDKAMKKGDRPLAICSSSSLRPGALGHTAHIPLHTQSFIKPTFQGSLEPWSPNPQTLHQVPLFCGGECGQGWGWN